MVNKTEEKINPFSLKNIWNTIVSPGSSGEAAAREHIEYNHLERPVYCPEKSAEVGKKKKAK